jgi:carboxypeptidase D
MFLVFREYIGMVLSHFFLQFFFYSGSFPQQPPIYFNRTEVKEAIHAPLDINWVECSSNNVTLGPYESDTSLPPAFTVLPNVIEKNKRTVIVHGLTDFIFIADGFVPFSIFFPDD